MKPAHLHLTLAMLKLYSEERRQLARQVWGQLMLAGASGCHLLPCCLGDSALQEPLVQAMLVWHN